MCIVVMIGLRQSTRRTENQWNTKCKLRKVRSALRFWDFGLGGISSKEFCGFAPGNVVFSPKGLGFRVLGFRV